MRMYTPFVRAPWFAVTMTVVRMCVLLLAGNARAIGTNARTIGASVFTIGVDARVIGVRTRTVNVCAHHHY